MKEDIKEILIQFLNQVENEDHTTRSFPSFYRGLDLKVGFGFGNTAKIPWITFLGPGQTPQEGIFPVFYLFKEHHKLILSYGISETVRPKKSWLAPVGSKTIAQYFKSYNIIPHKYGLSYVFAAYSSYKDFDFNKIESDIISLIDHYKKLFPLK